MGTDVWELYDVRNDFSLSNNLAAEQPAKLKQMQLYMKDGKPASTYNFLGLER